MGSLDAGMAGSYDQNIEVEHWFLVFGLFAYTERGEDSLQHIVARAHTHNIVEERARRLEMRQHEFLRRRLGGHEPSNSIELLPGAPEQRQVAQV